MDLETHGLLSTFDGTLRVHAEETWCERQLEPTSTTDLGEVNFTVEATWDSAVRLKGKKLITVRTSVDFDTLLFDGDPVSLLGESIAVSWATRMPIISIYEFI